ncbi:copper resistance protein NlpE N-terminal domain-containing protein [Confluentibacter citreus]|uniref:copper resistance protein NlpE N-terminal domain-containing protein n=1 Tax=Confluentibacter citreus TaxID=2007307 RepID=UPI0012FD97E1|nr:copper resistance protein NlpE N-terminal domain-containing protein [Confluentibacter citreus]
MLSIRNIVFCGFLSCHLAVFAQLKVDHGVYQVDFLDDENEGIQYTLTLNEDHTFKFHFFRKPKGANNPQENYYAKGTWASENNSIFFDAEDVLDLNEEYTLNLKNSKARFNTKSPRDVSARVVKTSIKFYDSELFWVKGLELFKI